jgi:hypothetical protein
MIDLDLGKKDTISNAIAEQLYHTCELCNKPLVSWKGLWWTADKEIGIRVPIDIHVCPVNRQVLKNVSIWSLCKNPFINSELSDMMFYAQGPGKESKRGRS